MSLRLNVDEAAVVVGGLAVPKQRYLPTSHRYLWYLWRLLEVSVLRRRSPDKVRLEALAETEPGGKETGGAHFGALDCGAVSLSSLPNFSLPSSHSSIAQSCCPFPQFICFSARALFGCGMQWIPLFGGALQSLCVVPGKNGVSSWLCRGRRSEGRRGPRAVRKGV